MSRFRRANHGNTFFFTVVSYHRRPILCDAVIRTALREAIQSVRRIQPFAIDGWVLLPDHLHCIWTLPPDDTDFSQRWLQIKHRVSYTCGDLYRVRGSDAAVRRGESTIWQRRFWEHQIRSEADMQCHMDYIHFNPVKHGHVAMAAEWPYSTFWRYAKAGIYAADWGGRPEIERLDVE
ncbi:transposase [uncultured Massilia sp.]|uniref:REP-associated tyrosine transposase n=1 Tax=uncultured Massilia sp. TaxID=169973 RepID=UPI0025DBE445|nr:transposase [uncultured Massilia sp.]